MTRPKGPPEPVVVPEARLVALAPAMFEALREISMLDAPLGKPQPRGKWRETAGPSKATLIGPIRERVRGLVAEAMGQGDAGE